MGSNEWKTAGNWPVPETKETILYLGGDGNDAAVANAGKLTWDQPGVKGTDTYLYDPKNPAAHIIDMSENELEVPEDYTEEEKREDILCYSTECLKKEVTMTGDVLAQIYLSSDCEDTDLIVRITDVDKDGR